MAAFVAVPSPAAALRLLQLAQSRLAAALTAFELMSEPASGWSKSMSTQPRLPLAARSPWYVLLEVSDTRDEAHAGEAHRRPARGRAEQGIATDAALSASLAQFEALWALREDISESQGAEGKTIKHDISLPISRIAEFIATTDAAIAEAFPGVRMVVFGHLGDGNLHYNVSPAAEPRRAARRRGLRRARRADEPAGARRGREARWLDLGRARPGRAAARRVGSLQAAGGAAPDARDQGRRSTRRA